MKKNLFLFCLILSYALVADGVYVIVNPIAGGIDKEAVVADLKRALQAHIFYTKGPGDGTKLAREAVKASADLVIAVGGDGTINEVGTALIGSKTALGIIPTGSGNGFARSLHIPTEPSEAIAVIKRDHRVALDTVRVNERSYLGVAGVGFDAEVGWRFASFGSRGFASYLLVTLETYPGYQPQTYDLIIDGTKRQIRAFLISFANSPEFGNGAIIAPHAHMRDGYMNIIIIKPFPFYLVPDIAYKLFHGGINHSSYVQEIKAKEVTIHHKDLKMQIDGEPALFPEGVHLRMNPASLQVVVP